MSWLDLVRLAGCGLLIVVVAILILFMLGSMRISSDVDRRTGHDELDDDKWQ